MQKHTLIVIIVLCALAACSTPPTPVVLPTLVPSSTPLPPTLAETPLPSPEPDLPTATQRSLPPTWTPTPEPSDTPTRVPPSPVATVPQITPLDVCSTFAVDPARTTVNFPASTEPVVAWTPVEGAEIYRVIFFAPDPFGNLIEEFSGYTDQTSYTFTRDLVTFEIGELYGWEVYPIDNLERQMCISRGGQLTPTS